MPLRLLFEGLRFTDCNASCSSSASNALRTSAIVGDSPRTAINMLAITLSIMANAWLSIEQRFLTASGVNTENLELFSSQRRKSRVKEARTSMFNDECPHQASFLEYIRL